jgi:lambda family phage portal protein
MTMMNRRLEIQELAGHSSPSSVAPVLGEVLPPDAGASPSAMVGESYDAANRMSKEMFVWSPPIRSADGDMKGGKTIMDARVRDTVRNDAYAAAGAEIRKDSIVGAMFLLNAKPNQTYLGYENKAMDDAWAEEFQREVETKFTLWAESPNCYVDMQGVNSLTGLVRLGIAQYTTTGEVLGTLEYPRARPQFRTAVQMIDPDRLSTPPNMREDEKMRMGVEKDNDGAPIAYHFRDAHPGDAFQGRNSWTRVARAYGWGREKVIHIFDQQRAGQTRGVSCMVAALKEARITKRFREVTLQNAVLNATYAATIESELPSDMVFQALGGAQLDPSAVAKAIAAVSGGYMSAYSAYTENADNLLIDGIKVPHLLPGMKLNLHSPSKGGMLGTEFEQSLLRYIAAILGVSYEQLSKDYSKTNYSSARAANNETWKTMQSIKRMVADRFATKVYMAWLEEAIAIGEITSLPRNAPSFWERMNRDAYATCQWIGASRGQIDELKETQAAALRLSTGLSTFEEEHARLGKDYRQVFAQLEREQAEIDKRGLLLQGNQEMMAALTPSKTADKPDTTDARASGFVEQLMAVEHEDEDEDEVSDA